MRKFRIKAITIIEILTTLIIISILAALALPQFTATRERSLSKEARANLKLIDAAEKIYRMEEGFYYPYSGSVNSAIDAERQGIYSYLKLAITPAAAVKNWDYNITGNSGSSYSSVADRTGSGGYLNCQYKMNNTDAEPTSVTGTGCP